MNLTLPARASTIACAIALSCATTACTVPGPVPGQPEVIRVADDASLTAAGERATDGDVILIAPGTYHASIEVSASDVTIRGEDRGGVILDGELALSSGIVATGERIAVENLTVRNYLQNGILITGVTDDSGAGIARGPDGYVPEDAPPLVAGYLVQNVTASNNGLYGIYAFGRSNGVIRANTATGGSDSGIYVGQCDDCSAVVEDNIVESNAVGIELANATGVVIARNRIARNRIGVSVLSNYLEAHGPSSRISIVGNLVADNDEAATPAQAGGAFGIGIGLAGTVDVEVERNRIVDNDNVGVWISSSEDFPPTGTRTDGNVYGANGLDIAYTTRVGGEGNCFRDAGGARTDPASIGLAACEGPTPAGSYAQPEAPDGIPFSEVALPTPGPGLAAVDEAPRDVPAEIAFPSTDAIDVPDVDLLSEGAE